MIEVARRKKKSSELPGYESEALRELIETAKEISKKLDKLDEINKKFDKLYETMNNGFDAMSEKLDVLDEIDEKLNKIEIYET